MPTASISTTCTPTTNASPRLSFEERFATIQQAAPEAVGDFRAEATVGRDELFVLRRRLNENEIERERFRARHRIERPARLASLGKVILKIGVLAILFIIEVVINGSFLAKANLGGLARRRRAGGDVRRA